MTSDQLKMRDCLISCLRRKGYPNLTLREVLALTKEMWVALEDENLVQPGMTYKAFKHEAEEQAMEHMDTDELMDYFFEVNAC